ncbi:MAG TPA: hypothetical protein VER33_03890 [Polyangiaceae bacterium]|nr:hypothetical protein [Polyangiaceae bacterium]
MSLLTLIVACGSSDGEGDGDSSGGIGGTARGGQPSSSGGSSGSPNGGAGGRAGAPGGGSGGMARGGAGGMTRGGAGGAVNGGAAGTLGGGAAGTAGGAPAVPGHVFNPSLPPPSYDCRTDTQTKQCISIRGTLNGQSIDRHCALDTSPLVLLRNPDVWPAACAEDNTGTVGYWYQLNIPIQMPGSFSYNIGPGSAYGADVGVAFNGRGGDVRSSHFVSAVLAGSVRRDATTTNDILVGTFRAAWAAPAADCDARLTDTCGPADVHGTFKVEHYLKLEDFQ